MKKPYVSEELLRWLDHIFPNSVPKIETPDREVWASVGARRVVDHLRAIQQHQVKEALGTNVHGKT